MSRSVARPKECLCRVTGNVENEATLAHSHKYRKGAQVRVVVLLPRCRGALGIVGKGLVTKHARALAHAESAVTLIFAVKCSLAPGERLHDGMRDIVPTFLTVRIAAANHEQSRRVCNDDAAHVFRLSERAVGPVGDGQRQANEIGNCSGKPRRFVFAKAPLCKTMRPRPLPSKAIHSMVRRGPRCFERTEARSTPAFGFFFHAADFGVERYSCLVGLGGLGVDSVSILDIGRIEATNGFAHSIERSH